MRLSTIALPLLAAHAAADQVLVYTTCGLVCNSQHAIWNTNFGHYRIDANEGCRSSGQVPSLRSFCFDWGRERAHFFFSGQGKRCLKMRSSLGFGHTGVGSAQRWVEVPCTW